MTVGVAPARPMQPDPPPASPPFETSSAPSRPPSDCRIPAFRCASGTAPASRPGRGATRRCLGSIAAAVGGTYSLAWRPPAFVGPRPADIPSVRVYDGLCRKAGVVVQPSSVLALRPGTRREDGLEVSNSLGAIVLLAFLRGRPAMARDIPGADGASHSADDAGAAAAGAAGVWWVRFSFVRMSVNTPNTLSISLSPQGARYRKGAKGRYSL